MQGNHSPSGIAIRDEGVPFLNDNAPRAIKEGDMFALLHSPGRILKCFDFQGFQEPPSMLLPFPAVAQELTILAPVFQGQAAAPGHAFLRIVGQAAIDFQR